MAPRRPDGAALLVAGFGLPGAPPADPAAVHTLGQIGAALLSTGEAWQIRRLTTAAGERYAADRATLKRHLDDLAAEKVRATIVVLLGAIVEAGGAPALVTGPQAREYPEDATLPLAWIRERLIAAQAGQLVVAVSARGEATAARWLDALRTGRAQHLIAIDAPADGNPLVDALLAGLYGHALDPRTGTVTMASLSEHLAAQVPGAVMQGSEGAETIAQPPPFDGDWDLRHSQLANRPQRPRTASGPDDLSGTVLPGQFRLDRFLARGTFGTVYRARQLGVQRDVAVKVLHADIDPSSEDGRLFVHEIRSVGQIEHTNVVRIHQADVTHDGRLFFAMELLDGNDLQQLGKEGRLPRERAVELVRQLLAGLGAAHDAGLVHADVKPANAIVVVPGRKLSDSSRGTARERSGPLPAPRPPAGGDSEGTRSSPTGRSGSDAMLATSPASGRSAPRPPADAVPLAVTEADRESARTRSGSNGVASARLSANGTGVARAPSGAISAAAPEDEPAERLVLVDFGLARLRAPDRPAESAGGTPAFMAPEQLHEGRVDARSDLYSAALVLVFMLYGWRRSNVHMLAPPPDIIEHPDLRAVLAQALDPDPAKRFQSARELILALTGHTTPSPVPVQPAPVLPFRHLAPLTELDRGRLHGRETDLALLTEHVMFRRSVIYTAPSGTGKTSLLRAGLIPRLEALGMRPIYQRCRGKPVQAIADLIVPGSATVAEAVERWQKAAGGRLVLVLDQLESAIADPEFLPSVLGFDRWPAAADVAVVLSIREDYLARLVARTQELEPGMPIIRLSPLGVTGARAAILGPLVEARLAIEPELLDALLEDLVRAAAAIGPEMGWGDASAVYPPHLQLACTVLYEHLAPGEATLTLAHYRRLGGFDAIVGEHLERVLDTDLGDGRDVVARDLFVALVTTAQERAIRPESELLAMVGAKHGDAEVAAVLEILRSRGLLVRVLVEAQPCWELVHDSLIPRVLAWVDARDLARRRAIELVRYHLRRSTPEEPSLLDRAELRELKLYPGAIAELDEEWKQRGTDDAWTPGRLIDRSRRVLRRRTMALVSTVCAAIIGIGISVVRGCVEQRRIDAEQLLRARDMGRAVLSIEAFDWDPVALAPTAVRPGPDWKWKLHALGESDPNEPGPEFPPEWLVQGTSRTDGVASVEELEAHGGPAYLIVDRGGCGPSIVPVRLPSYTRREHPQLLKIRVPTCAASLADMIPIPAGRFIYGGVGDPPAPGLDPPANGRAEDSLDLAEFYLDRTEVTNAAFGVFAGMSSVTGVKVPRYLHSTQVAGANGPRKPVTFLNWFEARAYCRFLGKSLPTTFQWVKAMRGGEVLPDGKPNPTPRRNLPWGGPPDLTAARLAAGDEGSADVATYPRDVSPYGIRDMAGNVSEWTDSPYETGFRIIRGGEWGETKSQDLLLQFMSFENPRDETTQTYGLGLRCAAKK